MEIPPEVAEGVAQLIRMVCSQNNGYKFTTNMPIGDFNYKINISLLEVDPIKQARVATIIIKREE